LNKIFKARQKSGVQQWSPIKCLSIQIKSLSVAVAHREVKIKRKKAPGKTPGRPKIAGTSIEGTIKQLLSLPATAETKIRLIKAALDI
jgi:hypothetical protein